MKQLHHDGTCSFNDNSAIVSDDRDDDNGGASHEYRVIYPDRPASDTLVFRRRGESKGLSDEVLMAILIDRSEGFQAGPFASNEGFGILYHLNSALSIAKARRQDRHRRNVQGKNEE